MDTTAIISPFEADSVSSSQLADSSDTKPSILPGAYRCSSAVASSSPYAAWQSASPHYTMKGTTSVPRCAHSFSTHRYRCALILLLPSSSRKLTSAVYSTHGLPSVPIRPPCAPFVHFETDVYLTHRMSDGTLRLSHALFLSLTLFFFGVKCAYLTVLSYLQCSFGTH